MGTLIFFSSSTIRVNVIEDVYPKIAVPGDVITVTGKYFGKRQPHSWLMVGSYKLKPEQCIEWTDSKIVFEAPEELHEDMLYVVTKNKPGNRFFIVNKAVLPVPSEHIAADVLPVIEAIDFRSASVGNMVTIRGKNFGQNRNTSSVLFTGSRSPLLSQDVAVVRMLPTVSECSDSDFDYEFWSEQELKIRIPDAACSGNVVVITEAGMSNAVPFTVQQSRGAKKYSGMCTYTVTAEVEITHFQTSLPNSIFLRVPIPQKTGAQPQAVINSVFPEPFVLHYQGATLHRFSNIQPNQKVAVTQEYTVTRSRVETELSAESFKAGEIPYNMPLYQAYTKPDMLVLSDDDTVKKLAKTIVKNEHNPYHKARRIYDYLVSEFLIEKNSSGTAGYSILTTVREKRGDAYDAAVLFCALARASGIPAIPSAGLLAVPGRTPAVHHWWAEFYLNGFGWVPVDPAYACDVPFDSGIDNKKDWFFGNLDAYRIVFSRGVQEQTPMLPNGVTAGRPRSYAFRSIWEETTATIESYSALWRLPKVIGHY